jgi:hypothetical protein
LRHSGVTVALRWRCGLIPRTGDAPVSPPVLVQFVSVIPRRVRRGPPRAGGVTICKDGRGGSRGVDRTRTGADAETGDETRAAAVS